MGWGIVRYITRSGRDPFILLGGKHSMLDGEAFDKAGLCLLREVSLHIQLGEQEQCMRGLRRGWAVHISSNFDGELHQHAQLIDTSSRSHALAELVPCTYRWRTTCLRPALVRPLGTPVYEQPPLIAGPGAYNTTAYRAKPNIMGRIPHHMSTLGTFSPYSR